MTSQQPATRDDDPNRQEGTETMAERTYQPPQSFTASLESCTAGDSDDLRSSVTVTVVSWSKAPEVEPTEAEYLASEEYADGPDERELVEIDTNYKPTRQGQYPVRLTRADTIRLATNLLAATEDTFHHGRRGRLRATEAAELLQILAEVDFALQALRADALGDLLRDTGLTEE